jgi:protein gp37
MAQDSKIEWTHDTANLWHGCTKVHAGCDNCYALALSRRWGNDVWGNDKPRKEIKSFFNDLDKFQKLAKTNNEVRRVFVGSMMDIFEKPIPVIDSKGIEISNLNTGMIRETFFYRVNEKRYPNLMFLLLTKRPSNINKYIPFEWKLNPPSNVMFGTSPVNQDTFDKLVGQLLEVNGKRFLSIEPQLDSISLPVQLEGIDWIIQGGESGHHKRPFNLMWARSLMNECSALNIPYFFKQIDKVQPIPQDLLNRQFPSMDDGAFH